jgi:outer membrane receptor protein involved in Fe transport
VLPALALAFFIGIAAGGSGQDTKKDTAADAKPAAAKPQPTMTVTATATETAAPAPAPTVTATKTVKVTKTVTAEAAVDSGSGSDDSGSGSTYYTNCTAARAAGVTPLYRGDPGYDSHLDRDGDGVACE